MKSFFWEQPARFLLPLLFFFISLQMGAAAISSKQSGPWTTPSTWEGGVVPTNFQDVIIKAGHTVTRNNAFTCQAQLYIYGTLVYQGNVARQFEAYRDIEIQGQLRMEGGSLFADGLVYGNGLFKQTAGNTTFGRAIVLENTDIQGGTVFYQNINNGTIILDNLSLKNATLSANAATDVEIKVSMNWKNGGKVSDGTHLHIEEGASLTFDGGNSVHSNDGTIENYGSMYCGSGAIDKLNGSGKIYNYGYWEFNVQANAASYVTRQNVLNWGGQILKKGPGSLTFSSSGSYYDDFSPVFHVQEGAVSLTTSSFGHELNGLWQVDAGATLLAFAYNTNDPLNFNVSKFINNGNVYGRVKFVGGNPSTLEGNGKYERMEIAKSGSEVTLVSNTEVTLEFTLTDGRIVLNQYDLKLGTATIQYTSNYNCYIETNGTGSCVCQCPSGGSVFYPIGNANFAPLQITLSAGSTTDLFRARVTDSFYGEYNGYNPGCTDQVSRGVVAQNWIVAEQTAGGSQASMIVYWYPSTEQNGFDRSNCTLAQYVGGNWQPATFKPASDVSPLVAILRTNITSFGIFGVYDAGHEDDVNFKSPAAVGNSPLCEWDDLQLHANTSQNADIQWSGPNGYTSSITDPLVPGIHPSQGGVYTIKASQYGCPEKQSTVNIMVNPLPNASILGPSQIPAGQTATLTAYGGVGYSWSTGEITQSIVVSPAQTSDYQVSVTSPAGCVDVALHTVQVGGATATHEAAGSIQQLKIAPNPAIDGTTLTFESAEEGEAKLTIVDARGISIFQEQLKINTQNTLQIPLANYPAGIYQIILTRKDEVKAIRVVKLMGE